MDVAACCVRYAIYIFLFVSFTSDREHQRVMCVQAGGRARSETRAKTRMREREQEQELERESER